MSLSDPIAWEYGVKPWEIAGWPAWAGSGIRKENFYLCGAEARSITSATPANFSVGELAKASASTLTEGNPCVRTMSRISESVGRFSGDHHWPVLGDPRGSEDAGLRVLLGSGGRSL
jgi:hypothetical protein